MGKYYVTDWSNKNKVPVFKISGKVSGYRKDANLTIYLTSSDFSTLSTDVYHLVVVTYESGSSYTVAVGSVVSYEYTGGYYVLKIGSVSVIFSKRVAFIDVGDFGTTSDAVSYIWNNFISDVVDSYVVDSLPISYTGTLQGTVSDVLDELAKLHNAVWYVDYDSVNSLVVLKFVSKSNVVNDKSSTVVVDNTVLKFEKRVKGIGKYATKVVVFGSVVDDVLEAFEGNNQSSFTLKYLAKNVKRVYTYDGVDVGSYTISHDYTNWNSSINTSSISNPDFYAIASNSTYGQYSYVRKIHVHIDKSAVYGGGATETDPKILLVIPRDYLAKVKDQRYMNDVKFVKADATAEYPFYYLGEDNGYYRFLVKLVGETFDTSDGTVDVDFDFYIIYGLDNSPVNTTTMADVSEVYEDFSTSLDSDKWSCVASVANQSESNSGYALSGSITIDQDSVVADWSVSIDTTSKTMSVYLKGTVDGLATYDSAMFRATLSTTRLNTNYYKYLFYSVDYKWKVLSVVKNANIILDDIAFSVMKLKDANGNYTVTNSSSVTDVYNTGIFYINRWSMSDGSDGMTITMYDEYELSKYALYVEYEGIPVGVAGTGSVEVLYKVDNNNISELNTIANAVLNLYSDLDDTVVGITMVDKILSIGLDHKDKVTLNDVLHGINDAYIVTEMQYDNYSVNIIFSKQIFSREDISEWATEIVRNIRQVLLG